MRALSRSLRLSGAPVPVPWPMLSRYIRPRAQNMMAVLACPGVGKSFFALEWAMALKEPSLYVSLDTDLFTQAVRVISRMTRYTTEEVSEGYDTDEEGWVRKWEPYVESLGESVRFVDRTGGTRAIAEMVSAETEYWGSPPPLTIIDNVGDLLDGPEAAQEYQRVFGELKRITVEHHTFVVALHHIVKKQLKFNKETDEQVDATTLPVHMSDGLYGGDRSTHIVLGLWRPQPERLRVAVLKNRMGKASPGGHVYVDLHADFTRSRLYDLDVARLAGIA